jgi:glucose uptake protein GlcU
MTVWSERKEEYNQYPNSPINRRITARRKFLALLASLRSLQTVIVTTAFQLLGASLWGVFALGNWPGIGHKIIGFTALRITARRKFLALLASLRSLQTVIRAPIKITTKAVKIGARMTVWSERKEASNAKNLRRAVILLLIGEFGFCDQCPANFLMQRHPIKMRLIIGMLL